MYKAAHENILVCRSLIRSEKKMDRNLSFESIKIAYQRYFLPKSETVPYYHICQVGDPVLRARASPVPPEIITTDGFQKLLEHMKRVMRNANAVGLAAPQIGISMQIFVTEVTEKRLKLHDTKTIELREMETYPAKVFINPTLKIRDYSLLKFPEGCLSIRGFTAEVPRARAVMVSGLDDTGKPCTWEAKGWAARIAQHEMEHLNGKLYIEKMDTSTFICTGWREINKAQGRIELRYYDKRFMHLFSKI